MTAIRIQRHRGHARPRWVVLQQQREFEAQWALLPKPPKAIPEWLRRAVFERDGHACVRCGKTRHLRADHVIPEKHGGPTTLKNLQTLCAGCNTAKGSKMPWEWQP